MGIIEYDFKSLKAKLANSDLFLKWTKAKNVNTIFRSSRCRLERVLEREGTSL